MRLNRSIVRAGLAVALVAPALVMGVQLAQAVPATPDLSGTWTSVGLTKSMPGYTIALTGSDGTYSGVIRFHYQDGKVGPRIKIGATNTDTGVTIVMPGGSLASDQGLITGKILSNGNLSFPKCYVELKWASKKMKTMNCVFVK